MGAVLPGGKKQNVLSEAEFEDALKEAREVYDESRCTREAPGYWKAKETLNVYNENSAHQSLSPIPGDVLQKGLVFRGWMISGENETPGGDHETHQWLRVAGERGRPRYVRAGPAQVEAVPKDKAGRDKLIAGGKEATEQDPLRESWPFWGTRSEDLGEYYGPGVRLHFRWLGLLTVVSLAAAMLSLPLVYFSTLGAALDPFLTGSEGWLRGGLLRTTLGNLGTEDLELHGVWVSNSHITSHAGMQDALVALLVFAAAVWFERVCIRDAVQDETNRFVNAGNFALEVTRLPDLLKSSKRDSNGGEEFYCQKTLQDHFDTLLSASVTKENVFKGLTVVRADDKGNPEQRDWREGWCCRRRLRDHKGRRLGRVVQVSRKACTVRWAKTEGSNNGSSEMEHSFLDDDGKVALRHVPLLAALESQQLDAGLDAGTSRVEEVALVRDGGYAELKQMATDTSDGKSKWTVKDFRDKCRKLPVIRVYVIFTHVKYRDFLEQAYRFSHFRPGRWMQPKQLRLKGSAIEVGEAPVPGDIMWENLDLPWESQCLRKVVSFLACFALLSVIIIFLTVANNALEDAKPNASCEGELHVDLSVPVEESLSGGLVAASKDCMCHAIGYRNVWGDQPEGSRAYCKEWVKTQATAGALFAVVCTLPTILSLVGGTIIEKLAKYERSPSMTCLNNSVLVMSCFLNLLYYGVLQVFLHRHDLDFRHGFFDLTPEWFALVGSQVLMTLFATLFYPILGAFTCVGFHFSRWRSARNPKCTREELKKSHTPPQFPIAVQEAATLSELIATLLFSCCMPFLWVFALVRVPLYYLIDKWVLLRGCHRPPRFDHHMALSVAKCVQVAAWFHCALAVWTYGNPNLMVSAANLDVGKELDGTVSAEVSFLQEFLARQRRSAAWPNSLVFYAISLTFVARLALFIQGHSSSYSLSLLGACCASAQGAKAVERTGMLSQEFSKGPLKSMESRGLMTSYEMLQNCKYGALLQGGGAEANSEPAAEDAAAVDKVESGDVAAPEEKHRKAKKKPAKKPRRSSSRRRSSAASQSTAAEAGVATSERV